MTTGRPTPDTIVVGAGLSGLIAARTLVAAGQQVVVIDKGRSVGGRLATRRLDDHRQAIADHGAQFFTVRDQAFAGLIGDWPVTTWHHGPMVAPSIMVRPDHGDVRPPGDGHPRYVGTDGMNAIAKHLADGLDVRTSVRITAINSADDGWSLTADDGQTFHAPRVLVTSPVPQTIDMVNVPLPQDVTSLTYDPCLVLLAILDGPAGIGPAGAVQFDGGPVNYVADNQAKGISARPALTVHAAGDWSREWYDEDDNEIDDALRQMVTPWLQASIVSSQVKRWRYATPLNPHPERALEVAPRLVLAGDAFGGPKVEGAVLSGLAAADILG